jgi:hypothetical protein
VPVGVFDQALGFVALIVDEVGPLKTDLASQVCCKKTQTQDSCEGFHDTGFIH